jgi:hypothetical protein
MPFGLLDFYLAIMIALVFTKKEGIYANGNLIFQSIRSEKPDIFPSGLVEADDFRQAIRSCVRGVLCLRNAFCDM